MGRVIARVAGSQKPEDELIEVLALVFMTITIVLGSLSIPPREGIISLIVSATLGVITGVLFALMLHRMVVATFTEDGLVIGRGGRRGGVFIPKSVVVTGNVICIRREPKPILSVTYESFSYTIPLASKRVYNRLVSRLREHWGWTLPECPN